MWGRRYASICVGRGRRPDSAFALHLRAGLQGESDLESSGLAGSECVNTLVTGHRSDQGDWYDRTGLYRARQRGKDVTLYDFTERVDLQLVSLPCWSQLSREEYAAECLDLVETIEKETVERQEKESSGVLGVTAILNTHPQTRPEKVKKSPAPLVHAKDAEVRREMIERYRQFAVAYWSASKALRSGETDVRFPEGSFPPSLPYVARARAPD